MFLKSLKKVAILYSSSLGFSLKEDLRKISNYPRRNPLFIKSRFLSMASGTEIGLNTLVAILYSSSLGFSLQGGRKNLPRYLQVAILYSSSLGFSRFTGSASIALIWVAILYSSSLGFSPHQTFLQKSPKKRLFCRNPLFIKSRFLSIVIVVRP